MINKIIILPAVVSLLASTNVEAAASVWCKPALAKIYQCGSPNGNEEDARALCDRDKWRGVLEKYGVNTKFISENAVKKFAEANQAEIQARCGQVSWKAQRAHVCKFNETHCTPDGRPKPKEAKGPDKDCKSTLDCQKKSRAEQKKAEQDLAKDRKEHQSTISGSQDLANAALKAAVDYMSQWGNSMSSGASSPSPEEVNSYMRDEKLVAQAIQTFDDPKKPFELEKAATASNSSIGGFLSLAVASRDTKGMAEEGDKDLAVAQAALQQIGSRTEGNIGNLSTMSPGSKPSVSKISGKGPTLQHGATPVKPTGNESTITSDESESLVASGETKKLKSNGLGRSSPESSESNSETADSASTKNTFQSRESIRDVLRRRLLEGGSRENKEDASFDRDALNGTSFENGMGGSLGADASLSGLENSLASEKTDEREVLQGYFGSTGASGASASEGGRSPASLTMDGLLGAESLSLFARVKSAHRSCLARSCL